MISTIYKVLQDMGWQNLAVIAVILTLFIDITPGIKFNPIMWIIKRIGTAFNHSIDKKIDDFSAEVNTKMETMEESINSKIDNLENEIAHIKVTQADVIQKQLDTARALDIAEIDRLKGAILQFSNSLARGHKFTLEEYRTVMDQHTQYERLIDKYDDLSNGKIETEYNFIVTHYNTHRDCGEFMF